MEIFDYKGFEYSEVDFNELYGDMRIDSDYYDPFFIRNAELIQSKGVKAIKEFMSPPQYGLSIAMNEEGEGYKILKMDDIRGLLANDENAKYADISHELFKQFKLKKFDVLFNRVNSDEFVGRTGIYFLDGAHTFASYLIRINSEYTYQNCYLTVFLNCKYGYHSLQRVKRRAVNQANINAQELRNLKIPLPDINFQRKIENLIVESFSLKRKAESNYKSAEKILIKELGYENWIRPESKFKIGSSQFSTQSQINICDFFECFSKNRIDSEYWDIGIINLEENLKKGNYYEFGSLLDIRRGDFVPTKYYNTISGVPYIRIKELSLSIDINENQVIYLDGYDVAEEMKLKCYDFIFAAIGATLGKVNLIRESFDGSCYSNNTARFRIKSNYKNIVSPNYLILVFQSFIWQLQIERRLKQTAQAKITDNNIGDSIIPIISEKGQNQIHDIVESAYKMKKDSEVIIEIAKRAVELYIENNEELSLKYIDDEINREN